MPSCGQEGCVLSIFTWASSEGELGVALRVLQVLREMGAKLTLWGQQGSASQTSWSLLLPGCRCFTFGAGGPTTPLIPSEPPAEIALVR